MLRAGVVGWLCVAALQRTLAFAPEGFMALLRRNSRPAASISWKAGWLSCRVGDK